MRSLIFLCLFVLSVATAATEFEDCVSCSFGENTYPLQREQLMFENCLYNCQNIPASSTGTGVVLDFEGCTTPPCIVKRGSNYAASIFFKATKDATSVTNHVTAKIAGIDTPWPGLDLNGCNNLMDGGTPCPVSADANYVWYMDVAILKIYPKISTMATIKFLGNDKSPIVCIKIPVTIV